MSSSPDPKNWDKLSDKDQEELKKKVELEIAVQKATEKVQEQHDLKSLAPGFPDSLLPFKADILIPTEAIAGNMVEMLATASSPWLETGPEISEYHWNFGNGRRECGALARTTFKTPGTYEVRVTMVALSGAMAQGVAKIVVRPQSLQSAHRRRKPLAQ